MISSARASTDSGIVRPRAFAVFRLIASSNLVGCSTGRSAGLAPVRSLAARSPHPAAPPGGARLPNSLTPSNSWGSITPPRTWTTWSRRRPSAAGARRSSSATPPQHHRTLGPSGSVLATPQGQRQLEPIACAGTGDVSRPDLLDGLLHEYYQAAARIGVCAPFRVRYAGVLLFST
jgi:hypothetical protein